MENFPVMVVNVSCGISVESHDATQLWQLAF